MDILDKQKIYEYSLTFLGQKHLNIHVFESIDSTNQFLKNHPSSTSLELCCAETQTNGRGRLGRSWYSPVGENIYCSLRWQYSGPIAKLSALSLVVGLAILAAFRTLEITQNIYIKWPNDLFWDGKKMAGILIESTSESLDHQSVVIGIGLNVNTQTLIEETQTKIDRPWCSLRDITNKKWDRNQLIGIICGMTHQYLERYLCDGFSTFIPEWEKYDGLYQQLVEVTLSNRQHLVGIALGVREDGLLQVMDKEGKIHLITSGEVTRCSPTPSKH